MGADQFDSRLHSADDVGYVQKVTRSNQAGLSLKDIAIMRDCLQDRPQDFCPELRHKLQVVREEVGEKMAITIGDLQQGVRLIRHRGFRC
ncbi:MAG: hypothetical protein Q4B17_06180 [Lautropia sp.]|nr:hypothetical protein [Lautropia sp.]